MLVGPLECGSPTYDVDLFQDSELTQPGYPGSLKGYCPLYITRRAPHAFFALMYGANLNYEHLGVNDGEFAFQAMNHIGLDVASAICAYGEYFQCLEFLKPAIYRAMQSCPEYWKAVAYMPERHCTPAKKLGNPMVFSDAMRHMVAQADKGWSSWSDVAGALECAEDRVRNFFPPELDHVKKTVIPKLVEGLLKLQLHPVKAFYDRRYTAYTTLFRLNDHYEYRKPDRSEGSKADLGAEYLARTHYGQWLVGQLYGEIIWWHHSANVRSKLAR